MFHSTSSGFSVCLLIVLLSIVAQLPLSDSAVSSTTARPKTSTTSSRAVVTTTKSSTKNAATTTTSRTTLKTTGRTTLTTTGRTTLKTTTTTLVPPIRGGGRRTGTIPTTTTTLPTTALDVTTNIFDNNWYTFGMPVGMLTTEDSKFTTALPTTTTSRSDLGRSAATTVYATTASGIMVQTLTKASNGASATSKLALTTDLPPTTNIRQSGGGTSGATASTSRSGQETTITPTAFDFTTGNAMIDLETTTQDLTAIENETTPDSNANSLTRHTTRRYLRRTTARRQRRTTTTPAEVSTDSYTTRFEPGTSESMVQQQTTTKTTTTTKKPSTTTVEASTTLTTTKKSPSNGANHICQGYEAPVIFASLISILNIVFTSI